jgi:hypothetical protein
MFRPEGLAKTEVIGKPVKCAGPLRSQALSGSGLAIEQLCR